MTVLDLYRHDRDAIRLSERGLSVSDSAAGSPMSWFMPTAAKLMENAEELVTSAGVELVNNADVPFDHPTTTSEWRHLCSELKALAGSSPEVTQLPKASGTIAEDTLFLAAEARPGAVHSYVVLVECARCQVAASNGGLVIRRGDFRAEGYRVLTETDDGGTDYWSVLATTRQRWGVDSTQKGLREAESRRWLSPGELSLEQLVETYSALMRRV